MRRVALIALGVIAIGALFFMPSASGEGEGKYKVRAIFDNGSFLVPDEEVRIAGASVGLIESVDVSGDDEVVHADGTSEPGKAVIVLSIEDEAFQDFREDASCLIRPQSLIGERFVDCTPTQPRAPGSPLPPELEEVPDGQPGEGQRLLPIESNGKSVDLDLVNNINRASYRDRFRIILNELGAGLAARGDDLGAVVDRANPALRQTNRVLKILADQSDQLDTLATDGDTVLQPLAENREALTGFLTNARIAGEATAERGQDLRLQLQKFPATLREVRLTMKDLRGFADQGTPLVTDIASEAKDLTRATQNLGPFARAGVPALRTLGQAAETSGPKLVASDPVIVQTRNLTNKSAPSAKDLSALLDTFEKTKGIEYLMDFIYYSVANLNSFDQFGHFQRAQVIRTNCTEFEIQPFPGCEAFFIQQAAQEEEEKEKKKKKSKKSVTTPRAAPPAPAPPQGAGEPTPDIPPLEEIIPELEPSEPAPSEPGQATPSEPAAPADPAAQGDEDAQAANRTAATNGQPMTMEDASVFLDYLLGASS